MHSTIIIQEDKIKVFDFFCIKPLSSQLLVSIKKYGVLDPLVVISYDEDDYAVISGASRLICARECGICELPVYILSSSSDKDKISNYLKVKILLNTSKDQFATADRIISILLFRQLDILDDNRDFFINDLNTSASLLNYLNKMDDDAFDIIKYAVTRNIPLKLLTDIIEADDIILNYIANVSTLINPKQNIMRQIFLLVSDLVFAGKDLPEINNLDSFNETTLFEKLTALRYPDYITKLESARHIEQKINNLNAQIYFPPYFEGGYAEVKIKITSKSDVNKIKKILSSLNNDILSEIIGFFK